MKAMFRLIGQRYFRSFVFIHINKTAGSSIERALNLRFEHKTAREKYEEIGAELWRKKFVFSFVRNPWDKVVSHYHYRVRTNQTGLGDRHLSFDSWVRLSYGDKNPAYYDKPKMFMPQVEWLIDEKREMMVDFVGRFEHLEHDFRVVCEKIGRRAVLPHVKKSSHADYRSYYSPATRQIVAEWFAEDIRQFNYTFQGD